MYNTCTLIVVFGLGLHDYPHHNVMRILDSFASLKQFVNPICIYTIYLSIHSIYLSNYLFICWYIYPYIHSFIHPFIQPAIYAYIDLSIYPSICWSNHSSIIVSVTFKLPPYIHTGLTCYSLLRWVLMDFSWVVLTMRINIWDWIQVLWKWYGEEVKV